MSTSPLQVNAAVRAAYLAAPGGGLTGVNVAGVPDNTSGSILQRLAGIASGFIKSASSAVSDPYNVLIPGGKAAAASAAKAAETATAAASNVAKKTAAAVENVSGKVALGAGAAVFIIILAVGAWVWGSLRPRS